MLVSTEYQGVIKSFIVEHARSLLKKCSDHLVVLISEKVHQNVQYI